MVGPSVLISGIPCPRLWHLAHAPSQPTSLTQLKIIHSRLSKAVHRNISSTMIYAAPN
jgi:hypothetical protein